MNLQNKLIKLYNEIDELKNKDSSSDSDFKAWKTDVQLCLSGLYGEKSIQLKNFNSRQFSPIFIGGKYRLAWAVCARFGDYKERV